MEWKNRLGVYYKWRLRCINTLYFNYVYCVQVLQRYYSHHDGCCVDVETLRFWVGTWNINGGKQFRSIAHKHRGEAIEDWLLDIAHLTLERHPEPSEVCYLPALRHESASATDPSTRSGGLERGFDVYIVGFEEMVDLNASNIFNTSLVNQREWGAYLHKLLNSANLKRFAATQQQPGAASSDSPGGSSSIFPRAHAGMYDYTYAYACNTDTRYPYTCKMLCTSIRVLRAMYSNYHLLVYFDVTVPSLLLLSI